jgi:hypothetical protein
VAATFPGGLTRCCTFSILPLVPAISHWWTHLGTSRSLEGVAEHRMQVPHSRQVSHLYVGFGSQSVRLADPVSRSIRHHRVRPALLAVHLVQSSALRSTPKHKPKHPSPPPSHRVDELTRQVLPIPMVPHPTRCPRDLQADPAAGETDLRGLGGRDDCCAYDRCRGGVSR